MATRTLGIFFYCVESWPGINERNQETSRLGLGEGFPFRCTARVSWLDGVSNLPPARKRRPSPVGSALPLLQDPNIDLENHEGILSNDRNKKCPLLFRVEWLTEELGRLLTCQGRCIIADGDRGTNFQATLSKLQYTPQEPRDLDTLL